MAKHLWPLLLVAACSANDDVPAPQLSSIVPDHASAGSVVLVEGNYFCQRPVTVTDEPTCSSTGGVNFGASPGTVTGWMDTAIMVEVPPGAQGSVSLSVVVNGRSSNAIAFVVQ